MPDDGLPNSEFWEIPKVRAALAEHNFADVFRAVMAKCHYSQRGLAGALDHLTQPQVNAILAGKRRLTHFDLIRRVVHALGAPPGLAGFACCPCEHRHGIQATRRTPPPKGGNMIGGIDAWSQFRRAVAAVNLLISRDLAAACGLSEPEYNVVSSLWATKGLSLPSGDLRESLGGSSSQLSHLLGRMELRGFVTRTPRTTDGRSCIVTLTEAGAEVAVTAAAAYQASVRRHLLDPLGPGGVESLAQIAARMSRR